MKKILGLSTLALASVLAFTGCNKISLEEGNKWAEENGYIKEDSYQINEEQGKAWAEENGYIKEDSYQINEEQGKAWAEENGYVKEDVYKITWEQVKKKIEKAILKSKIQNEASYIETDKTFGTPASDETAYCTFNETGYYGYYNDTLYLIKYDQDSNKFVTYINGEITNTTYDEFNYSQEFWDIGLGVKILPTLELMLNSERLPNTYSYFFDGEKIILEDNSTNSDGMIEFTTTYIFTDKIEKIVINTTAYEMEGEEKKFFQHREIEYTFTYEFNDSIIQ